MFFCFCSYFFLYFGSFNVLFNKNNEKNKKKNVRENTNTPENNKKTFLKYDTYRKYFFMYVYACTRLSRYM